MSDDFGITDVAPEETPGHVTPDHKASRDRGSNRSPVFGRPGRNGPRERPKRPAPANRPGQFVEPLTSFYTGVAMVAMPFDTECAMVVLQVEENTESKNYGKSRAQICAESLDQAAQKNETLRRMLDTFTTAGTWSAVLAAHAPILLAIAQHHTPLMSKMGEVQQRFMNRENTGESNEAA